MLDVLRDKMEANYHMLGSPLNFWAFIVAARYELTFTRCAQERARVHTSLGAACGSRREGLGTDQWGELQREAEIEMMQEGHKCKRDGDGRRREEGRGIGRKTQQEKRTNEELGMAGCKTEQEI